MDNGGDLLGKRRYFLASLVLSLLLMGGGPAFVSAQQTEVSAIANYSYSSWNLRVAVEKGFFKEENLDVKIVGMDGTEMALKGLIGGLSQIALTSLNLAIMSKRQGAPVVIIGSVIQKPLYELIAGPRYRSIKDLKGETLAVHSMSAPEGGLLRKLLQRHGLLYPRDYVLFQVAGGAGRRLAALIGGRVAATLLAIPNNLLALEQGMVSLGSTVDIWPAFEFVNIVADQRWLEAHPEAGERFMTAWVRSNRWLYDPKNKSEALRILEGYSKFLPKHASLTYEALLTTHRAISLDGNHSPEGFQQTQKVMVELGQLDRVYPMTDFVDASYLRKALERAKSR